MPVHAISQTPALAQTAPASSAEQTVPSTVAHRVVFGYFTIAGGTDAGSITVQVDKDANGTWATVQRAQQPAADSTQRDYPYAFAVPGGGKYRFVKGAGTGVTETIAGYSYQDL